MTVSGPLEPTGQADSGLTAGPSRVRNRTLDGQVDASADEQRRELRENDQDDSFRLLLDDAMRSIRLGGSVASISRIPLMRRYVALLAAEDEQPATAEVVPSPEDRIAPEFRPENMPPPINPGPLLSATPPDEHLPVFHIVEGVGEWRSGSHAGQQMADSHWHVRVVSRNGRTLLSSENYTEQRGALEAAHLVADPMGARVVVDS